MTIVSTTIIHPNPGVNWDDVQKQLKRGTALLSKHGAENVTVLVTMVGGQGTNAIGMLATAEDWAGYGNDGGQSMFAAYVKKHPKNPTYKNDLGFIWCDHDMKLPESEKLIREAIDLVLEREAQRGGH